MYATLPMYDLPALQGVTDDWWSGLAGHLREAGVAGVPARLSRSTAIDWTNPGLLFSQTCGYPLVRRLSGRVHLLGTPCYDAPGCEGHRYASVLVVAARSNAGSLQDLRGGVCAFNEPASHSGYNALRRQIAPLAQGRPFFSRVQQTGSHAASIRAVGSGDADLCAVDAVLHALLVRHAPEVLEGTRVLGFSDRAPGLPWVAGSSVGEDQRHRLRAGIQAAFEDARLADLRRALLLDGFACTTLGSYDEILDMEREAIAADYPELA